MNISGFEILQSLAPTLHWEWQVIFNIDSAFWRESRGCANDVRTTTEEPSK
ncbi:MAG: hypothetical protein HQL70_02740 [Magnetococcales bacterium]|nr:hypothetical protein [Magnetococcales bacterium]